MISESGGTECEVPEAKVNRWKRILEEFDVMQNEMREAVAVAKD